MKISLLLITLVAVLNTDRRRKAHITLKDEHVQAHAHHHHHHHHRAPKDAKVNAVADEVLNQISNIRYKAHEDKKDAAGAGGGDSPLDKVNVGELSCRPRNPTNVGLD